MLVRPSRSRARGTDVTGWTIVLGNGTGAPHDADVERDDPATCTRGVIVTTP
jgi:hypothetical protein